MQRIDRGTRKISRRLTASKLPHADVADFHRPCCQFSRKGAKFRKVFAPLCAVCVREFFTRNTRNAQNPCGIAPRPLRLCVRDFFTQKTQKTRNPCGALLPHADVTDHVVNSHAKTQSLRACLREKKYVLLSFCLKILCHSVSSVCQNFCEVPRCLREKTSSVYKSVSKLTTSQPPAASLHSHLPPPPRKPPPYRPSKS